MSQCCHHTLTALLGIRAPKRYCNHFVPQYLYTNNSILPDSSIGPWYLHNFYFFRKWRVTEPVSVGRCMACSWYIKLYIVAVLAWTGYFWLSSVTLQKWWWWWFWWLCWCKVGEIISLPVIHFLTIKKNAEGFFFFVDRGTVNGERQNQEHL